MYIKAVTSTREFVCSSNIRNNLERHPPSARGRTLFKILTSSLLILSALSGCDDDPAPQGENPSSAVLLSVILPDAPSDPSDPSGATWPALVAAASDLEAASREVDSRGESERSERSEGGDDQTRSVRVTISPELIEGLGEEGYELDTSLESSGALSVSAATSIGAAYGLYHIAGDLGARYIHPEESHFIPHSVTREGAQIPNYERERHTPHFKRRGFHEHTQHPIVMSEYLLRPDVEGYREGVSRYLRWLLRNRQNTLTFHLLNTIDFEAWLPYLTSITAEAAELGIEVGLITGFVDQQQNAFRLVMPDDPRSAEEQITEKLDQLTATGISLLGLQLGTSEFTKPNEGEVLERLNLAVAHLALTRPELEAYAWIHITCGLNQESGKPFYHIPLDADPGLGAFVHTTMFYTIDHPAPVYDCEDFTHQRDFLDAADGERRQVFFPETAWWLGFDNNVPLVNPITGASREYDILEALPEWEVEGHVTFTTGREWTYWQYDHYLTQVTWSGDLTWRQYLEWLAPIYGEHAEAVSALISAWTDAQWRHFYEENPELYFYLAGELPQDEIGEQAGVIARQPKLAYRELLEMSDEEFTAWQTRDLEMLARVLDEHRGAMSEMPALSDDDAPIYVELWTAYHLYAERAEHALELYRGVSAIRSDDREQSEAHLAAATEIGRRALESIRRVESLYRYPIDLLTALNPESPTAYPFGYLHETSTAYFWTRREEQLAQLISDVFDAPPEVWGSEVGDPLFIGLGEDVTLSVPQSPVLQGAIGGFIPQLVVRPAPLTEDERLSAGSPEAQSLRGFVIGQDYNLNDLPDPETALRVIASPLEPTEREDGPELGWRAQAPSYPLIVRDAGGAKVGQLTLVNAAVTLEASPTVELTDSTPPTALWLAGDVSPDEITVLITSFAGIETEALAQLIKSVWGLPPAEPLPETLPLLVRVTLTARE